MSIGTGDYVCTHIGPGEVIAIQRSEPDKVYVVLIDGKHPYQADHDEVIKITPREYFKFMLVR